MLPFLSSDPDLGATAHMTVGNALGFLQKTVRNFPESLRGKDVLDYGCGQGLQCCALAQLGILRSIAGVDIRLFDEMRENAIRSGVSSKVRFVSHDEIDERHDVVYSCSSFEHFADPERELRRMIDLTWPGGEIIISWAEPWYSPYGSHCSGYTGLPWTNLFLRERRVMKIRSRYRNDGAMRYEDVEGGLNRMTVARFERILMEAEGVTVSEFRLFAVKGLPLVTKMPILRELLTSAVSCVLRKS